MPPASSLTPTPAPAPSGTPAPACSTGSSCAASPRPGSTWTTSPARAARSRSRIYTCASTWSPLQGMGSLARADERAAPGHCVDKAGVDQDGDGLAYRADRQAGLLNHVGDGRHWFTRPNRAGFDHRAQLRSELPVARFRRVRIDDQAVNHTDQGSRADHGTNTSTWLAWLI